MVNSWNAGRQASRLDGKVPANYAGFYNNTGAPAGGAVDFGPAATTGTPAVVHIKTKTKARQVSNNSRQRYSNPFADLFGDDGGDMGDFFGGPRMIP
jgi:serine protease Do